MDTQVLTWLQANLGRQFKSPRVEVFGRRTEVFEITSIKPDRVYIRFGQNTHEALPLLFSMFDRVLDCLRDQDRPVRLGAKVNPPYEANTIEAVIWQRPYPGGFTNSYKAGPHVCDILVLAGLAEYLTVLNPKTSRRVQGVKVISN